MGNYSLWCGSLEDSVLLLETESSLCAKGIECKIFFLGTACVCVSLYHFHCLLYVCFYACINVYTGVCIIKVVMPRCGWGGFVGADPRGGLPMRLTEILPTRVSSYSAFNLGWQPWKCLLESLLNFIRYYQLFSTTLRNQNCPQYKVMFPFLYTPH